MTASIPFSVLVEEGWRMAESRGRRRGVSHMSPTLLLLGVSGADRDLCTEVIDEIGGDLIELEAGFLQSLPRGEPRRDNVPLDPDPALRRCLARAVLVAGERKRQEVATLDLLIALVEASSEVQTVVERIGLKWQGLSAALRERANLSDSPAHRLSPVGPLLARRMGLGREVACVLAVEPPPTDGDGAFTPTLRSLYSQLAPAAILAQQRRPGEALAALRRLDCQRCAIADRLPVGLGKGARVVVCAPACPGFPAQNPGYAALPDPQAALVEDLRRTAIAAYLQQIEGDLAAAEPDGATLQQHWEALREVDAQPSRAATSDRVARLILGRVTVLNNMRQFDQAVDLLRVAVSVEPTEVLVTRLSVTLTNRGVAAGNRKEWPQAIADLREALAASPVQQRARTNLAEALFQSIDASQGMAAVHAVLAQLIEIRDLLEEGVRLTGSNPEIDDQLKRISTLIRMGQERPDELIMYFRAANSPAAEHISEGQRLLDQGQLDEAEATAQRALSIEPDVTPPYILLSNIYEKQKRYRELISMQQHLREISPSNAYSIARRIANAYIKLGEYAEAVRELRTAVTLEPGLGEGYMMLGLALHKQGQPLEAIAAYEEAERVGVKDDLNFALSIALFELRREVGGAKEGEAPAQERAVIDPLAALQRFVAQASRQQAKTGDEDDQEAGTVRLLEAARLKFLKVQKRLFRIGFSNLDQPPVTIWLRVIKDFLYIHTLLPQDVFQTREEEALYSWLRGTYLLESVKLSRDNDGDHLFAIEVPGRLLNGQLLRDLIEMQVKLAEHAQQPPDTVIDFCQELALQNVMRSTRQRTSPEAPTGWPGAADDLPAAELHSMVARVCAEEGWTYRSTNSISYSINADMPELTLHASGIHVTGMFNLRTTMSSLNPSQMRGSRLALWRRVAALNMAMDLCKVGLDEERIMFTVEYPALSPDTFRQAVYRLSAYVSEHASELAELIRAD